MWTQLRQLIEKVRESDERTKKIWVWGMSAALMIVVIFVWLLYLNSVIRPAAGVSQEDGFWAVFKNGLKITTQTFKKQFNLIISQITGERSVIIEK